MRPALVRVLLAPTASSTLGAAIASAHVQGDVATWQESDADGVG